MSEYAEAGIGHYWLVETDPDVVVVAFVLAGGSYREAARLRDEAGVLPGPAPLQVDVTSLDRR